MTRHRYTLRGWGTAELWIEEGVVLAHELTLSDRRKKPPPGGRSAPERIVAESRSRVGDGLVADLEQRVHRLLGGRRTSFADVALDLSWCTPFQAELACALRGVPWGEIVTYGELAAHAGRPGAARAAGGFCARNRFWLLLPCHRVVASDGIGGYGDAGVDLKRRLLALENVAL